MSAQTSRTPNSASKNWQGKVQHIGTKAVLDLNGPLIL